ncbi:unnamed protein product [Amoebophrya sp. A120]|nr:unnamed protein product [Amoebophrya sp. A120]|eukprot:GSA120T00002435001.1
MGNDTSKSKKSAGVQDGPATVWWRELPAKKRGRASRSVIDDESSRSHFAVVYDETDAALLADRVQFVYDAILWEPSVRKMVFASNKSSIEETLRALAQTRTRKEEDWMRDWLDPRDLNDAPGDGATGQAASSKRAPSGPLKLGNKITFQDMAGTSHDIENFLLPTQLGELKTQREARYKQIKVEQKWAQFAEVLYSQYLDGQRLRARWCGKNLLRKKPQFLKVSELLDLLYERAGLEPRYAMIMGLPEAQARLEQCPEYILEKENGGIADKESDLESHEEDSKASAGSDDTFSEESSARPYIEEIESSAEEGHKPVLEKGELELSAAEKDIKKKTEAVDAKEVTSPPKEPKSLSEEVRLHASRYVLMNTDDRFNSCRLVLRGKSGPFEVFLRKQIELKQANPRFVRFKADTGAIASKRLAGPLAELSVEVDWDPETTVSGVSGSSVVRIELVRFFTSTSSELQDRKEPEVAPVINGDDAGAVATASSSAGGVANGGAVNTTRFSETAKAPLKAAPAVSTSPTSSKQGLLRKQSSILDVVEMEYKVVSAATIVWPDTSAEFQHDRSELVDLARPGDRFVFSCKQGGIAPVRPLKIRTVRAGVSYMLTETGESNLATVLATTVSSSGGMGGAKIVPPGTSSTSAGDDKNGIDTPPRRKCARPGCGYCVNQNPYFRTLKTAEGRSYFETTTPSGAAAEAEDDDPGLDRWNYCCAGCFNGVAHDAMCQRQSADGISIAQSTTDEQRLVELARQRVKEAKLWPESDTFTEKFKRLLRKDPEEATKVLVKDLCESQMLREKTQRVQQRTVDLLLDDGTYLEDLRKAKKDWSDSKARATTASAGSQGEVESKKEKWMPMAARFGITEDSPDSPTPEDTSDTSEAVESDSDTSGDDSDDSGNDGAGGGAVAAGLNLGPFGQMNMKMNVKGPGGGRQQGGDDCAQQ